jgi:hypothetical protein
MPHGHRGRHRRRRALAIALVAVLGAALAAWVGGSMIHAMQLQDFVWGLGIHR